MPRHWPVLAVRHATGDYSDLAFAIVLIVCSINYIQTATELIVMPSRMQRVQAGKANYDTSAIKTRNDALRRAGALGAVLRGATGIGLERLQSSERLLTVRDYCECGALSVAQGDKGREPHLLVPDLYNPGEFRTIPIYDSRAESRESKTGKCWIDVHAGELLIDGNAAVYWK